MFRIIMSFRQYIDQIDPQIKKDIADRYMERIAECVLARIAENPGLAEEPEPEASTGVGSND